MQTIQDVNSAILQGNFTNEQLGSIIDAVKFARARLTEKNKRSMSVGGTVKFTSSKTGMIMVGTVKKIAIKYVTVATNAGLWRVPANMLEVV